MSTSTYSSNVIICSSAGTILPLPLTKRITAIKYFSSLTSSAGNTTSSAAILSGLSATGTQLWFENTQSGHITDLLSIYDPDGVTVSLGGPAVLYIYLTISRGV